MFEMLIGFDEDFNPITRPFTPAELASFNTLVAG